MRLIDADELINRINEEIQNAINRGDIVDYLEDDRANVVAWLFTEPTAYDVNKVIEQICKNCLYKKECSSNHDNYECYLIKTIKASGMYNCTTTQEIDVDYNEHHFYAE